MTEAKARFPTDDFATIQDGKLKLKRDDKVVVPPSVTAVQKMIDARLPLIRIEQLLMDVDHLTQFSRHFTPVQGHQARPPQFYRTLIAALLSQATNLGVVSMSASVQGLTVDMLRRVLHDYIREETLTAANAAIVNRHHALPLSAVHGTGTLSSSDAQRFGIRASSLLASYYPRYYGYYEKAIGIYTHVSDQDAVFSTQVISCSPREALYVLDGLLNNNTILQIREHTTDTHGYTEIVFALCHLLGFYFMPRIRDLKDQQLYRVDRVSDYGVFTPLLTKTADLSHCRGAVGRNAARRALAQAADRPGACDRAASHEQLSRRPLVQGGDQLGTHYQDPIHLTLSDRSGPATHGATPAQQRGISPQAPPPDFLCQSGGIYDRGLRGNHE